MERLRIKNFLIIEDADFEVGRFNVIIGSQASGKSIIAKLLYFFRNFLILKLRKNIENCSKEFEVIFPKYIWENQAFDICYQFYDIEIKLNNEDGTLKWIFPDSRLAENKAEETLFIPANRSSFSLIQDNIFSLINNNATIDFFIRAFGAYYERAKKVYITNRGLNKTIEHIITDILKGSYEYESGQDWIKTQNQRIPLSYASSGQQESLPMLIVLNALGMPSSLGYLTVFIEEPEAHLFPVSQKRIIELLSLLYNEKNAAFVLTTHSPYIPTAINCAILAQDIINREGKEAVKGIFNPDFAIKYEDVRAYTIEDGHLKTILNDELRLISASVIDSVSDEFEHTFNNLLVL